MNGSGLRAVSSEGGQGLNQSGGSTAEPSLEQNQSNFPRTGLGTGYKIGPEIGSKIGPEIGSRKGSETGLETNSRIGLEPVSSSNSARMENI